MRLSESSQTLIWLRSKRSSHPEDGNGDRFAVTAGVINEDEIR